MRASIESIGNLEIQCSVEDAIHNADDLLGELIQVEDRRVCVQTDRMKLVAVLLYNIATFIMFSTIVLKILASCYLSLTASSSDNF